MSYDIALVHGNGSKLGDLQAWRNRAKRKIITSKLMLALIDVAKEKGAEDRVKSYWNTWRCQNEIIQSGDRVYCPYCKNRFCLVCTDIRKAHLINKYMPVIKDWERPCMTTLTIKGVPHHQLKELVDEMLEKLQRIIRKHNKRHERGKGEKFMGLRALECNFNATDRTYNPHFHILVPNSRIGVAIMTDWRLIWNDDTRVKARAQQTKSVLNKDRGMKEIVKYFSKIFSLPNPRKRHRKQDRYIYAAAIDNIIEAFQRHHTFDAFGIKLPKKTTSTPKEPTLLHDFRRMSYDHSKADWVCEDKAEVLTGYSMSQDLEIILEGRVDVGSVN